MEILGYTYKVNKDKTISELQDRMGVCYVNSQKISLAKDQTDDSLVSTFIHEIIEAINFHLELKMRHNQICAMEVGIYDVLKRAGMDFLPLLNQIEISEEPEDAEKGIPQF